MSHKETCPSCGVYTSGVYLAAIRDEPCPYCGRPLDGKPHDAPALTLTEFLLARIAEDEAAARNVESEGRSSRYESVEDHGGWLVLSVDPARVLAECEAKRRIVAKAQRANVAMDTGINPAAAAGSFALTEVLHFLALPYADHPDFDESWRL